MSAVIESALVILLAIALSACQTSQTSRPLSYSISQITQAEIPADIELVQVSVNVSDAKLDPDDGYLPYYVGEEVNAGIPPIDFQGRLHNALSAVKVFRRDADLDGHLTVELLSVEDIEDSMVDVNYRLVVRYTLTDASGAPIFSEDITSEYRTTMADAFIGSDRLQVSFYGSLEDNLYKFTTYMKENLAHRVAEFRGSGGAALVDLDLPESVLKGTATFSPDVGNRNEIIAAIQQQMMSAGVLQPGQEDGARMSVTLVSLSDANSGLYDIVYDATIRYQLRDREGTVLWDKTLNSQGQASASDALWGGTRATIAFSRAMENNVTALGTELAANPPSVVASGPSVAEPTGSGQVRDQRRTGTDFYAYEDDLNFNVIDEIALNPTTGDLTLAGHFDSNYLGPRIPYLQLLALLLENPAPEFSLDWTPESERAMDRFLTSMDDQGTMMESLNLENDWFNSDGSITEHGKQMVTMFGIEPVDGGRAPGWLGINFRDPQSDNEIGVVVTEVGSGSPAMRADIRPGDQLMFVNGVQPRYTRTLVRLLRKAGAGTTIKITVDRPDSLDDVEVTLGQGQDRWSGFTREEMIAEILKADGNQQGANVIAAIEESQMTINGPKAASALTTLYFATAANALGFETAGRRFNEIFADVQNGRLSERQGMERIMRDIFQGAEVGLALSSGSLVNIFDNAVASGQHPTEAFDVARLQIDELLKPVFRSAMQRALNRREEVVMTVEDITEKTGFTPVVRPTYIGLPQDTQLSRVLYQADYLGKTMVLSPALANAVPGFQTEYAYFADFGAPSSSQAVDRRLWFTIDKLDLGQSKDGNVLEFRDVQMRINIGPEYGEPSRTELGYANLLTSRFDALARLLPPFHELRETAKLAAAAKWLRSKKSRMRLPRDGRVRWQGPDEVPALVRLVWSPQRTQVAVTAPGGASLQIPGVPPTGPLEAKVPILDYPVKVDGATVDMRDLDSARPEIPPLNIPSNADVIDMEQVNSPAQWVGVPSFTALPRKRVTQTVPPVPQPLGFKALASRGGQLKRTLKMRVDEAGESCSAQELEAINEEAAEASRLMSQLAFTEKIMNAITAKNLDRKAAEAQLALYVDEAKQTLETAIIDIATRGVMDSYDIARLRAAAYGLDDVTLGVNALIQLESSLKSKREAFETAVKRVQLAQGVAVADDIQTRNRVMGELIDLMGELIENAENIRGNAVSARAMRVGAKAIKKAKTYAKMVQAATDVLKIGDALYKQVTFDGDSAAAKELHRQYKDRTDALNAALASPTIKALMDGSLCPARS